jgi:hypothetical protein
MVRLGHISFFGLGLLNLAYAFSLRGINPAGIGELPGLLLVVGAATMPTLCYLSAWRKSFRHLFFIPVLSTILGTAIFIFTGLM